MATGRRKKRFSLRNLSMPAWTLIGVSVLFILSAFLTGNSSLIKLYSLSNQKQRLVQEHQQLVLQQQLLRKEIDQLEKDMTYVEKVAREQYNLKRDDEEIYEVIPE